jgi:hypothetical protein
MLIQKRVITKQTVEVWVVILNLFQDLLRIIIIMS